MIFTAVVILITLTAAGLIALAIRNTRRSIRVIEQALADLPDLPTDDEVEQAVSDLIENIRREGK